ncbi:hypothetical protein M5E87_20000 [Flavonifractor plautii]|nr:hypothetical protein M5E87_20000 [Flavonifractor plautii]
MIYDRQITISVGASRATNWQAQTLTISELYDRLRLLTKSTETMAEYLALSKGQQDNLKDVGGYVAGTLHGPRRKAGAVTGRDVLTLDLDSIPAAARTTWCGGWRPWGAATASTPPASTARTPPPAGAAAAGPHLHRRRVRVLRPAHGRHDRHGAGRPLHL